MCTFPDFEEEKINVGCARSLLKNFERLSISLSINEQGFIKQNLIHQTFNALKLKQFEQAFKECSQLCYAQIFHCSNWSATQDSMLKEINRHDVAGAVLQTPLLLTD